MQLYSGNGFRLSTGDLEQQLTSLAKSKHYVIFES